MSMHLSLLEPLEKRRLFSATVIVLTPSPFPSQRASRLTLTADGASSDVKSVAFFLDSNSNGALDATDRKFAVDRTAADGFSAGMNTARLPLGSAQFFAVPADAHHFKGPAVFATDTIVNAPPTLKAIVGIPAAVDHGRSLTVRAPGAKDRDGTVAAVAFYVDLNGKGRIDQADEFLGADFHRADGFSWKIIPTALLRQRTLQIALRPKWRITEWA